MAQVTQQPLWGWRERSDRSPQRGGRCPDLQRGLISQALMGTFPIIPVQPALHFGPGLAQGVKQFGVEQFIPQRAVEALQVPVVVRLGLGHRFVLDPPGYQHLLKTRDSNSGPWSLLSTWGAP